MTQKHHENPITLFQDWLNEAKKTEINDAEAMSLATCTANGKPSVRIMLLKQADEKGFKFHTNSESQKGIEISENPYAALCFHWKSLQKQVRVKGKIKIISENEANEYFAQRPYGSQIGAWASQQSRNLNKIITMKAKYPKGSIIPRPNYWVGYRLIPEKIEFWWNGENRLHDRIKYTKNDENNWNMQRLYP